MPEIHAALIGAAATAFVMVLSNMSNRREKTIIDIYNRLNKLSQAVSRLEGKIQLCLVCLGKNTKSFYVQVFNQPTHQVRQK